jgi:putative flavoprotein involved in K+ transport
VRCGSHITVSFDGPRVRLSDGSTVEPDAVIAATGFTTGLVPLVGHLGVLDSRGWPLADGANELPSARGLYFVAIQPRIAGQLFEIARQARAVGEAIAAAA